MPTILPEQLRKQFGDKDGHPAAPPAELNRMATFEHLHSRLNPARGSAKGEASTLLCRRCNQRRALAEARGVFAEEHRRRNRWRAVKIRPAAKP